MGKKRKGDVMSMKSSTEKLFFLLAVLKPEDEYIRKIKKIEEISSMPEYEELVTFKDFSDIFALTYTKEKLLSKRYEELNETKKCIKVLPHIIKAIRKSIKCGNGYKMSKSDFPRWDSIKSLTEFYEKLHCSEMKINRTNIDEEHTMEIFSDSTIKDKGIPIKLNQYYCIKG